MNVGVILIALILVFAGAVGIVAMASDNAPPVTDTMGHTLSAASNNSHNTITATASPLAQFGGGLGLAVAVAMVCGTLFAVLALILYGTKGQGYSGRR
jgi:hypothetical protein